MKRFALLLAVVLAVITSVADDAYASRMGGGKSVGRQSSNVTQRQAMPAQQATPAPAAQAQRPAAQPPVAQPQPQRNRWLGPLAGLAAGIGLAALASHFGFGEELASFMMIALIAVAVLVVVRLVLARRAQSQAAANPAFPAGYAPASVGAEASVNYAPTQVQMPGSSAAVTPEAPVAPAGSLPAHWDVPADFDREGFVAAAKSHFVKLQAAFDSARLDEIREFSTTEMFDGLKAEIEGRHGAANRTDVVRLEAELLGIETAGTEYLASVRFTGLLRENESAPAEDFDEVWNLVKPMQGAGGWLLAGIQQLK